ncbi:MAG: hypothetical protein WA786_06880 [Acidimicrobiales bacterium]
MRKLWVVGIHFYRSKLIGVQTDPPDHFIGPARQILPENLSCCRRQFIAYCSLFTRPVNLVANPSVSDTIKSLASTYLVNARDRRRSSSAMYLNVTIAPTVEGFSLEWTLPICKRK